MSNNLLIEENNEMYKKNPDGTYTQIAQKNIKPLGTILILGAVVAGGYGMYRLGKKKR